MGKLGIRIPVVSGLKGVLVRMLARGPEHRRVSMSKNDHLVPIQSEELQKNKIAC